MCLGKSDLSMGQAFGPKGETSLSLSLSARASLGRAVIPVYAGICLRYKGETGSGRAVLPLVYISAKLMYLNEKTTPSKHLYAETPETI